VAIEAQAYWQFKEEASSFEYFFALLFGKSGKNFSLRRDCYFIQDFQKST
jgi:hypothetical protein